MVALDLGQAKRVRDGQNISIGMAATGRRFGRRLRAAMIAYQFLWLCALPLVLAYFWARGRRDHRYRAHLSERFGGGPGLENAVWLHAVSLGEMRSAVPLVRGLLDQGERVVTTHLTPAGRQAAQDAFASEIAAGQMLVRYLPLDIGFFWRRLYQRLRPKLWLVLEIEIWPKMIDEAARAGVPLVLVNSQLPERSLPRARTLARIFGHPVSGVAGVLAKSERHAQRFRRLGAPRVSVCGELRFEQPVPASQIAAAATLRAKLGHPPRGVITLASVVEGEDPVFLTAIEAVQSAARARSAPVPLFVYVPRAPERFDETAATLAAAGQRVVRRQTLLSTDLAPDAGAAETLAQADILLGDSMGEMYYYLGLCDLAVVGGGYVPKGAHNVIEPLALRKPVLVGPHVWTIEYPGEEAQVAKVLEICADAKVLAERIIALISNPTARAKHADHATQFLNAHAGATTKSLAAITPWLKERGND